MPMQIIVTKIINFIFYVMSYCLGKAKLGVEHKCIPYLFIAFHKLVIFIENIWIKSILFATWEDFAKVLVYY